MSILKRDARGRVRVPRELRQVLLEEFGRSGLSAMKFSELVGVRYPTFAGWLQQQRKEAAASGVVVRHEEPIKWVEAVAAWLSQDVVFQELRLRCGCICLGELPGN